MSLLLVPSVLFVLLFASATATSCPSACTCKWKGGKQTVECMERGLIKIPDGVDPETQVLDLSGNNLQILPKETFVRAGLLNLQRVFLRRCRIGQIDDLAFRGLTNLIELDLSHNLLTSIPSGTFPDVPFLRDLLLASNPIQKLDGRAFAPIPGLIKLDLSNCELQTVAANAFDGIELLESLKLNGNRLADLRLRTVDALSRLHAVELHDNPWHCDCRLRAVKEWLTVNNIPHPVSPLCLGGPERLIGRAFADLHVDDFACKPEILPASRYIEATAGQNASILCRANAVPLASIAWYWNGRPLLNNTPFNAYQRVFVFEQGQQEKRSLLVLTNAQEINSSEFYCVAENRAGNAEANFTLRVAMRAAGLSTLGSGQIAGLSVALVLLILFILLVILVLLVRLRRIPFAETKTTPVEVVTVVNGEAEPVRKPTELSFNPVAKPPRVGEPECFVSPTASGHPDLLNDTKEERPASGEYSRNADSLYPSGLWEAGEFARQGFYDDRTPIMAGSAEEVGARAEYPEDYGLPKAAPEKTLRVWQKGAVPVLPPVTALKRALSHSRSSPDEGYQEGCGTDV